MKYCMKYGTKVILLLSAILLLAACSGSKVVGNGKVVTKMRSVASFNQIKVSGNYQLAVVAGRAQSVQLTTDSNVQPFILTTVKKGVLSVSTKPGHSISTAKPVKLKINVKQLKGILASGATDINVRGIATKDFQFKISGSGKAVLVGKAAVAKLNISGAGDINARKLVGQDVSVKVSGTGQVHVFAVKKLDAKVSGTGDITYKGSPKVTQHVSGRGVIQQDKKLTRKIN